MLVTVGEVENEMLRLLSEAVGDVKPKKFDPQWILRNVVMACNHVHPILPNGWFTPQDGDVYVNLRVEIPRGVVAVPYDEVEYSLPIDLLRLRGVGILMENGRAELVYDYGEFSSKKANMGAEPVDGLNHYIFYQSGPVLRYYYLNRTVLPVRFQYVKRVLHPNQSGNVGSVNIAERAKPLIYAYAASKGRWGDDQANMAQAMTGMWERELTTSMLLQAQTEPKDPFLVARPPSQ